MALVPSSFFGMPPFHSGACASAEGAMTQSSSRIGIKVWRMNDAVFTVVSFVDRVIADRIGIRGAPRVRDPLTLRGPRRRSDGVGAVVVLRNAAVPQRRLRQRGRSDDAEQQQNRDQSVAHE